MSGRQSGGERRRLLAILGRFSRVRLGLWGDLVVDEFIDGQVNRISREAPVLILDYLRSHHLPGGAANTAANIAAAGAKVMPVGVVGDDSSGRQLLGVLDSCGVDTSEILVVPGLHTPTKTRVSGAGLHTTRQQIVRIDRGEPHRLSPGDRRRLAKASARIAGSTDGLVVGDYGYDTVDPGAVRRLARTVSKIGKLVAVDSRWRVLRFRGVTTVTPNEPEVEAALGVSLDRDDGLHFERAGREMLRRLDSESVLITRGSHGMAVFSRRHQRPTQIPVYGTDEVADVTGAGDTVMAIFAVALAAGASPDDAARLANYAGGLVVMKQGTATVSRDELLEAVERDR
jgi:rfaE bifunctional protein kinase chain/domain